MMTLTIVVQEIVALVSTRLVSGRSLKLGYIYENKLIKAIGEEDTTCGRSQAAVVSIVRTR